MHKALSSLEDESTYSPITPWSSAVTTNFGSVRSPGRSEDIVESQRSQHHGNPSRPTLTPKHRLLLMRLCPLLALESTLVRQLTGNDPPITVQSTSKSAGFSMGGIFAPTAAAREVAPSWWAKEVPDDDLPSISTGEPGLSPAFHPHSYSSTSRSSRTNTLRRPAAPSVPPSAFSDASFAPQLHDELSIQVSSWNQRMAYSTPPLSARPSKGTLKTPQAASLASFNSTRSHRSSISSQSPSPVVPQSPTPPLSRAPSVASFASTDSADIANAKSSSTFKLPNLNTLMTIRRVRSSNSLKNSNPGSGNGNGNGKDSPNTKGLESADLVMSACAADIAELWRDSHVRQLLHNHFGIRVEAEAGL
jgi:hypothetical protein